MSGGRRDWQTELLCFSKGGSLKAYLAVFVLFFILSLAELEINLPLIRLIMLSCEAVTGFSLCIDTEDYS